MPKVSFVTPAALKIQLGLEAATLTTADNERLRIALGAATHQIEQITGRWLVPRRAFVRAGYQSPTELVLDQDLMELTGLTNGDGQALSVSDVEFVTPAILRLLNGAQFTRGDEWRALPITVSGVWGWHENWSEAWRLSGDTINGILDPVGTAVIPVVDVDGTDPYGDTPRFQVGQLLRVDSEIMSVIAVNAVTNTLTVLRGEMGTATSDHLSGTSITIYNAPAHVEMLILRWATWLYKSPERGGTYSSIPDDLMDGVRDLRRVTVR